MAEEGDNLYILVQILSCKNLLISDKTSSDPYVKIKSGDSKKDYHQTKHILKTLNPIYSLEHNNTFLLTCTKEELKANNGILFKIKDWNKIVTHGDLGFVHFSPDSLVETCDNYPLRSKQEYSIQMPKNRKLKNDETTDAGTIELLMHNITNLFEKSTTPTDAAAPSIASSDRQEVPTASHASPGPTPAPAPAPATEPAPEQETEPALLETEAEEEKGTKVVAEKNYSKTFSEVITTGTKFFKKAVASSDPKDEMLRKIKSLTKLLTSVEDFNNKFTDKEITKCSLLQIQLQRILTSVTKQKDDDGKNEDKDTAETNTNLDSPPSDLQQDETQKPETQEPAASACADGEDIDTGDDNNKDDDGKNENNNAAETKTNTDAPSSDLQQQETQKPPPQEPAASSVAVDELTLQAQDYIAADVRLFSSCADGEDIDDTGGDFNNRASVFGDEIDEKFALPSASERGGGVFTTAFLHLLHENHKQQNISMSNREVLLRLVEALSTTGYTPNPILSSSRPHTEDEIFYIVPQNEKKNGNGTRRALLIGILYKGQSGELKNSHADVHNIKQYLVECEGFQEENITLLMDDGQNETPTRKNILNAFKILVTTSKCNDVVFLYYAGHGGQIEDDNGDEDDGYDETILPVDIIESGPISDDEIFETLVCPLEKGVTMTCIFDSSHSGTVLDLPFEFSAAKKEGKEKIPNFCHFGVVRKIQDAKKDQEKLEAFWESMTSQASGSLRKLVKVINEQSKIYCRANVCLFSACEDGDKAGELPDVNGYFEIPDPHGYPGGAFTTLLIELWNSQLQSTESEDENDQLTNRELMVMLRFGLERLGLVQRPVLSTSRIGAVDKEFRIIPKNFKGKRRAVMIGIRYKKSPKFALKGTHNDVSKMIEYLKEKQGFVDDDFTILMDDKKHKKPTRMNILLAYSKLVKETKPGDAVFCFFAGHGGQFEDVDNDEEDGFDETMIPVDVAKNGPIKDDILFKKLVCPMPKNVTMTCVFDCCNSGTILDLPFTFANDESQYGLLEKKPKLFPHMAYAKSLRENKE